MYSFGVRFVICNIFICLFIGLLMGIKIIGKKWLSSRIQYNLWFLLLILLAAPFLPIHSSGFSNLISRLIFLKKGSLTVSGINKQTMGMTGEIAPLDRINDFTVSISSKAPSFLNVLLLSIWLIGILFMLILFLHSWYCLRRLEHSALPLQNSEVQELFRKCLLESGVKKTIPVFSTAFLKSPVTVGFFKPGIYLPIHLISSFHLQDMRYMLLHELQHYRHKDVLIGHFICIARIFYWFNPLVLYALREMRCECEIACDSSVLKMLHQEEYKDYGNTLINFAEKISRSPFPIAAGIRGSMKQIKRRILNIAAYKQETFLHKIKGTAIYFLVALSFLGLSPLLSTYAAARDQYQFPKEDKNITYLNLNTIYTGYSGSFVLYDEKSNIWNIYNEGEALTRIAPNSTYKIYDALLGLESGIITPSDSQMNWNGDDYPFDTWEADQSLNTAMHNSVNWYFQSIDATAGTDKIKTFLKKISYGNQNIGDDVKQYWTDQSLKISPIEQVEVLRNFYHNDFHFSMDNINAVKQSLQLFTASGDILYGKTGTGRIDDKDVNGWFVGYVVKSNDVYYFATNIQGKSNTTGSTASEITLSVLSKMNIWN